MNTITEQYSYCVSENNPYVEEHYQEVSTGIDFDMQTQKIPVGTGLQEDNVLSGSDVPTQSVWGLQPTFKQWKGDIIAIEDNHCFLAKIQEISGKGIDKFVRFDSRKVEIINPEQFAEGASFFWKVGLFYNEKRMAVKKSEIRFRLLPPPNPKLIKEAGDEIRRIFDSLSWID